MKRAGTESGPWITASGGQVGVPLRTGGPKRAVRAARASLISRRPSAAPRQWWMPPPKTSCFAGRGARRSKWAGSGMARGSRPGRGDAAEDRAALGDVQPLVGDVFLGEALDHAGLRSPAQDLVDGCGEELGLGGEEPPLLRVLGEGDQCPAELAGDGVLVGPRPASDIPNDITDYIDQVLGAAQLISLAATQGGRNPQLVA